MMREREAHADSGGELGAVAARTEQPDRRQGHIRRHRVDVAERMVKRKAATFEQDQLLKALEKFIAFAGVLPPAQRIGGDLIGARRAAEPQIDAPGKQRLQHLEAFGDHQRRVIHQHHAAGADADVARRRGDLADHDLGRGTGDAREVMMLSKPIARVAEPVRKPRQIDRVAQSNRSRRRGGDRR